MEEEPAGQGKEGPGGAGKRPEVGGDGEPPVELDAEQEELLLRLDHSGADEDGGRGRAAAPDQLDLVCVQGQGVVQRVCRQS